jgi:PST family polysaccharide transporter/lipopolysaccharide exporter
MSLRERLARALGRLLPTDGDLSDQIVQSGIWITLMNVFDRALQFALLIVLARLLTPRDFGLLGIALLTLSALKKFTHLGLDAALIQDQQENVDQYLNTAWVLGFGRNLLIAVVIFLVAPLVAAVFSEPRVTPVIRVIALGPLFKALRNPGVVYFQKNLDLHKSFVLTLSGSVTNFVVAVAFALVYRNVWALVFGFVAADAVRFLVSYLIHPYRPWFEFDADIAWNLLDYGKWMTGSKILNFLYSEGDDAVVGWLLTATSLGFYQVAYRFSNAPATELTHVISRVMFPAYSKLQDDTHRLRDTFLQVLKVVTLLAFPMSVGIVIVAPSFVEAFLGEAWLPATLTMQILAVYGLLRAVGSTFGPVWKAVGRPDYLTKLAALRVLLIAVFIYPMTVTYGIEGTAFLITAIFVFPMMPLDTYLVVKTVDTSFGRFFREVAYPAVASLFMGGVLLAVQASVAFASPAVEFVVLLGVGIASYAVAVGVFERQLNWGLERSFRSMVNAVRG